MIKKIAAIILPIGILAAIFAWFLSVPYKLEPYITAKMDTGNPIAGETMFWAGGCGSCHAVKNAKGNEKLKLGGGHEQLL